MPGSWVATITVIPRSRRRSNNRSMISEPDDFFLKLFVASRLGPDRLREVARTQREVYLAELATLGNLRRQHREEPLVSLLIKAAVLQTEANLKVVEDADDQAEWLAMASGSARATELAEDATAERAASATA